MTVFKPVDKINRQLCFQKRGKLHVKYVHCNTVLASNSRI
jgi:hypothetical protein